MLGYFSKSKLKFKFLYWLVVGCCVAFPFIYIAMKQTCGVFLDNYAQQYTGQRFFTGREKIWETILDVNSYYVWFGQGVGFDTSILNTNLSTHNLYMYLFLEGGIVLVVLFLFFFYNIWRMYYNDINKEVVRWSAAFLLGGLLFLDFELFLIINNIPISLLFWFIITYGLRQVRQQKCKTMYSGS